MTNTPAALARELADIKRRLVALERSSRLDRASIEGGTVTVNDEAGQPVLAIGRQPDGGYAVAATNGGKVVADSVVDELRAELAVADGEVTEAKIAVGAVTGTKIAVETIQAGNIAAGAVAAGKIAAGAVAADQIAALAITVDKLAANAVTADKLAANSITADKIAADAIRGKTITGGHFVTSGTAPMWIEMGETVIIPGNNAPAIIWNIGLDGVNNPYISGGVDPSMPFLDLFSGIGEKNGFVSATMMGNEGQFYIQAERNDSSSPTRSTYTFGAESILVNGVQARVLTTATSAPCTTQLTVPVAATDIVGAAVTVTSRRANAFAVIHGVFDFSMLTASTSVANGICSVNGTAQTARATFAGLTAGARQTVAQTWRVSLPTPGSYLIKLQAANSGSSTATRVNTANTTIEVNVYE